MGRKQRNFPRGKFILRTPRETEKGQMYAVYIYYYWQGKQLRRSTDLFVANRDWNENANSGIGEFRATYGKDYREKNLYINKLLQGIDDKIFKYVEKNGKITCDVISGFLNGDDCALRDDKGIEFIEFAKERINQRYNNKQIGVSSHKNGITYINQFAKFLRYELKREHLYLCDINEQIVADFRRWYLVDHKADSANKVLQTIANVCTYAAKLGYLSSDVPLAIEDMHISDKHCSADDVDIKYLTYDELKRYVSIRERLGHPRQKEFHDMFMFSLFTCGLRLVDIITLKWEHIDFKKKVIKKVQIKTGNRNTVPFTDQSLKILEKWRGRNKTYVFDLLNENFDLNDTEALYKRRNSIDATINKSLERQAEIAGVNKLTFHMARHSWAVHALQQGVDVSKISALLGHRGTNVTEHIYAEFLPTTLSDVVEKINFSF